MWVSNIDNLIRVFLHLPWVFKHLLPYLGGTSFLYQIATLADISGFCSSSRWILPLLKSWFPLSFSSRLFWGSIYACFCSSFHFFCACEEGQVGGGKGRGVRMRTTCWQFSWQVKLEVRNVWLHSTCMPLGGLSNGLDYIPLVTTPSLSYTF